MGSEFNVVAVLGASVAAMLLGGLWYSPLLFEKRWRRLVDAPNDQDSANPAIVYGGAFLLMLLSAAVFHAFLGPQSRLCVRGRRGIRRRPRMGRGVSVDKLPF